MLDRARGRAARRAHADRRRGALDRRRGRRPLPRRAGRRAARRPARRLPRGGRGAAARGSRAASPAPTAPSPPRSSAAATAWTWRRCCASWSVPATWSAASCARAGREREWCDPEVLRRLRRASLASLRKEVEPAEQRALARLMPAWQGVDGSPPGAARESTACARCSCRSRAWRSRPRCGSATCCRGAPVRYSPAWMDQLCAGGELVWVGAGALGRGSGRVALYFREDARWLGPPPNKARSPPSRSTRPSASASDAAPASGPTCWSTSQAEPAELQEALWDLVWAGEVTNDAFAPLRAPRLSLARARARARPPLRRAPAAGRAADPGPLVAHRAAVRGRPAVRPAHARARRGAARALRDRHARDGAGRGRARRLRLALRRAGEPRDARHRPARLLRGGPRRRAVRARRRASSGCARCARTSPPAPLVLAATDPANPYGASLPWPKREDDAGAAAAPRGCRARTSSRSTPSRCSTSSAAARACCRCASRTPEWLRPGARGAGRCTCAAAASSGWALERFDGEPLAGTEVEQLLIELGFRQGPRAPHPQRLDARGRHDPQRRAPRRRRAGGHARSSRSRRRIRATGWIAGRTAWPGGASAPSTRAASTSSCASTAT